MEVGCYPLIQCALDLKVSHVCNTYLFPLDNKQLERKDDVISILISSTEYDRWKNGGTQNAFFFFFLNDCKRNKWQPRLGFDSMFASTKGAKFICTSTTEFLCNVNKVIAITVL